MTIQRGISSAVLWAGLIIFAASLSLAACGSDTPVVNTPPPKAVAAAEDVTSDPFGFPEVVPLEEPLEAPAGIPEELKTVWEVWALLTSEHVDRSQMDPEVFNEAAIRGLIRALDDPHTSYVSPESFDIENEDLHGRFEGIGANVSMRRDGKLQIVAPLKDSPAEAAGLKPGDVILEVDGVSILGLSLLEAVGKIRGPRGSEVRLLVLHLGAIDPIVVLIRRDVIPLTSVLLRSELGDRIAHIRLTSFYADTAEKLNETLNNAREAGAQGLILDVRDNPGGLLNSVVDVVSQFLDDGLVLYEVDGSNRRTDWKVRNGGTATDIPMVVLTNEFSASASEILVGAFQDYERATIIGATTYGKGSVNILRRLENGGGLYITFAKWFTPSGRPIASIGLVPDIEVVARDRQKAETEQLEKALEVLESMIKAEAGSAG